MDAATKGMIERQFGAAIDMIGNAVEACPDVLWGDRSRQPEFWYVVYHTLFWLDLYLSGSVEGFRPPAPFGLGELEPGVFPEYPFTKDELRTYLAHGRDKCRMTIDRLTEERAARMCEFGWGRATFAELLLYNMRHVQHHAAQLNLLLRQAVDSAPEWVAQSSRGAGKERGSGRASWDSRRRSS